MPVLSLQAQSCGPLFMSPGVAANEVANFEMAAASSDCRRAIDMAYPQPRHRLA